MSRPRRHRTPALTDLHRRRLTLFSRWHVATEDADAATHEAITAVCRRIDMGGLSKAETLATLDTLDGLLSDVWDRRPEEEV